MEFLFNLLGEFFIVLGARAVESVAKDERHVDGNSFYARAAGLVAGIAVVAVFGAMIGGVLYISFAR
ncbi:MULTISPECIES: hypothetical protein [unclassified Beijerinckia]|uniref:hypothetical protein n=1 Tax=unclassified Beijerinckia TaxID=2638183 RepID=UPI0008992102|nr:MULTISPECIES: hypothetical protein [unclassified Beijerinckia]MDH7794684.1 hypothetical protein [Beijerinckia sp. GAS462]SEB71135.1 hypothetical protein SAMN05443249_0958 [Beijerinckia sp. 28-YEA-48]